MPWILAFAFPWFVLPLRVPSAHAVWMLLAVLALIAEMASLRRDERTVRYAVPLLAVVWWQFGSLAAWVTDLAVLLSAAVGVGALFGNRRSEDMGPALLEASTAATVAGLMGSWVLTIVGRTDSGMVLGPATFVACYLIVSPVLTRFAFKRRVSAAAQAWFPGVLCVTLFFCLAVAGVVLVQEDAAVWTPLLLGPIMAIRALLLSQKRMAEASLQTVDTLASMLQRAHPYTHRHLERVAEISEEVALRLGLSSARAKLVHQAALLHDIGKIAIDEDILDLPRKLTDEEFDHVRLHAAYGGEILAQVDSMREVSQWIRLHHERPDGRGYPEGLLDPEIPIESKIIAAVDAFDAMTGGMEGRDGRPFRDPMSVEAALAELDRCSGTQFDPKVVQVFREVVGGAA